MYNMLLLWILVIFLDTCEGQEIGDIRLVKAAKVTDGVATMENFTLTFHCERQFNVLSWESSLTCNGSAVIGSGLMLSPDRLSSESCPDGWHGARGLCFKNVTAMLPLHLAQGECQQLGAQLAEIHGPEQNSAAMKAVKSRLWINLHDRRVEGRFEYLSGKRATYTNWSQGSPSNSNGIEHCVEMHPNGLWNDIDCNVRLPALCSVESESRWEDNFRCDGNETRFRQCPHDSWTPHECTFDQAFMVQCSFSSSELKVGQPDGHHFTIHYRGLLQVWHSGRWHYVCDRDFGTKDNNVICRYLGSLRHKAFIFTSGEQESLSPMNLGCTGELLALDTCHMTEPGIFNCSDSENRVVCYKRVICDMYHYGPDCKYKCGNCAVGRCLVTDGTCPGGACLPGFRGIKCDQACTPDTWGQNCSYNCGNCLEGTCDQVSGMCIHKGCQAGFSGGKCDTTCTPGTWGQNCSNTCGECLDGRCNQVSGICIYEGCEAGYTGEKCDQRIVASGSAGRQTGQESQSQSQPWVNPVVGVLGCFCALLLVGIIVLGAYSKKRNSRARNVVKPVQ